MSNMTPSVTSISSGYFQNGTIPLLSISVFNPSFLASRNNSVKNSGQSIHSPPDTVSPRMNGTCFFTASYTSSSVISLVFGELSFLQTRIQVSHCTQAFGLYTTFPSSFTERAPAGHCFTHAPQ